MKPRFLSLIVWLLSSVSSTYGQQGTATDVFPLITGYTWSYRIQSSLSCFGNTGDGSSASDTGIVSYSVLDSIAKGDSISWQIRTSWNLIARSHIVYPDFSQFDTTYSVIDTAIFTLWELSSGNHHLFIDNVNYYGNPIWKFLPQFADSQKISRYQQTDSLGRSYLSTNSMGFFSTAVPVTFTFSKDSGLIRLNVAAFGICGGHSSRIVDAKLLSKTLTSVHVAYGGTAAATSFTLYQNFPNPFNPSTTISYRLPSRASVTLKIFDLVGRDVMTLVSGYQDAGDHSFKFDGTALPTGVYFYRLEAGSNLQSKSLLLIK